MNHHTPAITLAQRRRRSATNEIEYCFEDLPLLTEGNVSAGLLSGSATIAYHIDDDHSVEWFVHEIYLDGIRKREGSVNDLISIRVDEQSQLYLTIYSELTDGSFKQHVAEKVNESAVEMMGAA